MSLWVGKRSASKSTWPGKLDHLVAGGQVRCPHMHIVCSMLYTHPSTHTRTRISTQPVGISCADNLVKECHEEAGVPSALAQRACPVSIVGCEQMQSLGLKRDVLFVYDLELPSTFQPVPQDGEVSEFKLLPVHEVMERIANTDDFKPNVELVVLDFCVRHGYLTPDQPGYARLLAGLRTGDVC